MKKSWLFTRARWKDRFLAEFSRLIRLQIESGIIITYGLKLMKEVLPRKLWPNIDLIIYHLEQGSSLEIALTYGNLPKLCITMVSIGESHGDLARTFEQCEWFYDQRAELKKIIKSTSAYPLLLMFLVILLMIFLTTILLPQFILLYQTTQIELPTMTKFLIISHLHLIKFFKVYLLFLGLFTIFIYWVFKTYYSKRRWYRYLLKLPIINNFLLKKYSYTISFYLSLFINNGLFLLKGLELLSKYPDVAIRDASDVIMKSVLIGNTLSESIKKTNIFLPSFIEMTLLYEKTGTLEKGLAHYSQHLQKQIESEMKQKLKWLEPIFLLIVGAILLFVLYALFLPIFTLISAI